MPLTQKQITDAIDTRLAMLLPALRTQQDAYASGKGGKFCQLLQSHKTPPADGVAKAADNLAAKPTDQAATWTDMKQTTLTETFSLEVHVHDGPQGKGWTAIARVLIGTDVWMRCIGQGPHSNTAAWAKVPKGLP